MSRALVRAGALGDPLTQADGSEGLFDRVGGLQVLPVPGREVEEAEQAVLATWTATAKMLRPPLETAGATPM